MPPVLEPVLEPHQEAYRQVISWQKRVAAAFIVVSAVLAFALPIDWMIPVFVVVFLIFMGIWGLFELDKLRIFRRDLREQVASQQRNAPSASNPEQEP